MGGSVIAQLFGSGGIQAPQYQDQTFSNDQIMAAAKGADQGLRDSYKAELINQLRAGNFKDGYGVYQNVLNGRERQAQMAAYDQQLAEQQAAQQDSGSWNGSSNDGNVG